MQSVRRRVLRTILARSSSSSPSSSSITTLVRGSPEPRASSGALPRGPFAAPWAAVQTRGCKVHGSDVRVGNVIEKNGRIFQVLKAQHTQQGRGGATIQVELRDVDSGNKSNSRLRTDETVEKVFVEQKTYSFLYQDGDTVVLMEPNTFEQEEVSRELFGNAAVYLKEDIPITLHMYDERIMSASIPPKVTCTVVDAPPTHKGLTAVPQYKKVLLDNGLTVSSKIGGDIFYNASVSFSAVLRFHFQLQPINQKVTDTYNLVLWRFIYTKGEPCWCISSLRKIEFAIHLFVIS